MGIIIDPIKYFLDVIYGVGNFATLIPDKTATKLVKTNIKAMNTKAGESACHWIMRAGVRSCSRSPAEKEDTA